MRKRVKKNSISSHPLLDKIHSKKESIEVGKNSAYKNFKIKTGNDENKKKSVSKPNFSIDKLHFYDLPTVRQEKKLNVNFDRIGYFNNFKIIMDNNKNSSSISLNKKEDLNIAAQNQKTTEKPLNKNKLKPICLEDALHENIINYIISISPTENDNNKRLLTIQLVQLFFKKFYPNFKVDVFGSFPQDLHLMNSDIDIVLTKTGSNYSSFRDEQNTLYSIRRTMVSQGFSLYENTIFINASVPIVKAKCEKTKVEMDIR